MTLSAHRGTPALFRKRFLSAGSVKVPLHWGSGIGDYLTFLIEKGLGLHLPASPRQT
jgi:hypothetical protein